MRSFRRDLQRSVRDPEALGDCRGDGCSGRALAEICLRPAQEFRGARSDRSPMKNPLDSIWGTVISGFVLTIILYFVVKALQPVGVA